MWMPSLPSRSGQTTDSLSFSDNEAGDQQRQRATYALKIRRDQLSTIRRRTSVISLLPKERRSPCSWGGLD
ncbi:unnamed protein product [Merluccius merluccius]